MFFFVCLFSELRHINSGFVELLFQELSFKWSVAERSPSSLNRELEWISPPRFIFFILKTKSLPCSLVPFDELPRKEKKIRTPTYYTIYTIIKLGVNWHRHMIALANQEPGFMRNRSPDCGATGRRVRWRLTGTHSGTRRRKLRAAACHFTTRTRLLYFKEVLLSQAR